MCDNLYCVVGAAQTPRILIVRRRFNNKTCLIAMVFYSLRVKSKNNANYALCGRRVYYDSLLCVHI